MLLAVEGVRARVAVHPTGEVADAPVGCRREGHGHLPALLIAGVELAEVGGRKHRILSVDRVVHREHHEGLEVVALAVTAARVLRDEADVRGHARTHARRHGAGRHRQIDVGGAGAPEVVGAAVIAFVALGDVGVRVDGDAVDVPDRADVRQRDFGEGLANFAWREAVDRVLADGLIPAREDDVVAVVEADDEATRRRVATVSHRGHEEHRLPAGGGVGASNFSRLEIGELTREQHRGEACADHRRSLASRRVRAAGGGWRISRRQAAVGASEHALFLRRSPETCEMYRRTPHRARSSARGSRCSRGGALAL